MAIAWDASVESVRTGTSDPHTWTHTPSGTPRAIVVAAVHGTSSTDHVSTVTYGGVSMARIVRATDTATEPGAAELWFLGSGIPTGNQTVSADLTSATTDDIQFVSMSFTASDDCSVVSSDSVGENRADPSLTLPYSGRTCLSVAALYGGGAAPSSFTPNGNCTQVQSEDLGAFYAYVLRQTSPGTSDFAIGGTAATDDVAYVALAVSEIAHADALVRVGSTSKIGAPAFSPVVTPTGFGLTASLGTPTASGGGTDHTETPSGYGLTVSLGTPAVTASSTTSPTGYGLTAALGTAAPIASSSTSPTGLAGTAGLGTPTVSVTALPAGYGTTAGLGTPTVTADSTVAPSGQEATTDLGTPTAFSGVSIGPDGYGLAVGLGTPTVTVSSTVSPTGFGLTASLGTPSVTGGSIVSPTGFGLTVTLGTPTASCPVQAPTPTGLAVTVGLGTPTVDAGAPPAPTPPMQGEPIGTKWQRRPLRTAPLVQEPEPVVVDAVVRVTGFGLRSVVGTTWQVADAAIAPQGFQVYAQSNRAKATGMHNPTDAQIVDWLLQALAESV